jgi:hypothetical protein
MPIDIVKPFLDLLEKSDKAMVANGAAHSLIQPSHKLS